MSKNPGWLKPIDAKASVAAEGGADEDEDEDEEEEGKDADEEDGEDAEEEGGPPGEGILEGDKRAERGAAERSFAAHTARSHNLFW
jgi:hypothetical protein